MAATLLASACPAPPVYGTVFWAIDQRVSGATGLPVSEAFSSGMTAVASSILNKDSALQDLLGRYGSGSYAVGYGLAVSAGSGLTVSVSAGHALMDGIVEPSKNASTVVVPASSSRAWVWLKQDKTFVVQDNTTAKPSGNCVLLGSCVTNGSGVTSVDTSGVVYLQNGMPWRLTADTGAPTDSPDATWRGFTKTSAGVFFWTGTAWVPIGPALCSVTGAKADANYTGLATEYYCTHIKWGITGWTGTHNYVVPSNTGQSWTFVNTCGQSVQVIAATGTGVTIATSRAASVMFDGTNVVRLTADSTL